MAEKQLKRNEKSQKTECLPDSDTSDEELQICASPQWMKRDTIVQFQAQL